MFRNWLLRTIIGIVAFTLIMAIFWGVQYSLNPHLLPPHYQLSYTILLWYCTLWSIHESVDVTKEAHQIIKVVI